MFELIVFWLEPFFNGIKTSRLFALRQYCHEKGCKNVLLDALQGPS